MLRDLQVLVRGDLARRLREAAAVAALSPQDLARELIGRGLGDRPAAVVPVVRSDAVETPASLADKVRTLQAARLRIRRQLEFEKLHPLILDLSPADLRLLKRLLRVPAFESVASWWRKLQG